MTRRYKLFAFATAVFLTAVFLNGSPLSAEPSRETDQSSEGMEMIARQMRSLSQSLDQMPGPPAFDQTLQIPGESLAAGGESNQEKREAENE